MRFTRASYELYVLRLTTILRKFAQHLENLVDNFLFLLFTGERPFACSICDKRFTQKSNVDKHQLTHASKYTFVLFI